ncbi:MAG: nickel-dependent hydrogenase large subunit [Desulfuromonadales bacterium]
MTRLIVDPLTRVEGHGRVELLLKDGRLLEVKVRLLESPRIFESLVIGRRYDEVPDLVCRICAICSAVHKVTSLQALENAMGMVPPPLAHMLRELLVLGGHIQSHALHLFCLIMPDLRGTPDVLALLQRKDELAMAGVELKAFGNRIQQIVGGRTIHPINPVYGGMVFRPGAESFAELAKELARWQRDWPALADGFLQAGRYPQTAAVIGKAVATGQADSFALSGDCLWLENVGKVPADGYASLLDEHSRADSYARDATGELGPFLTGALARARLAAHRGLSVGTPGNGCGIHDNNAAQVGEIGWALQRVGELLEAISAANAAEPLQAPAKPPCGGVGTAVMEAPRGLLVHHYVVDEWGTVVAADIVTPTSINQRVMANQIMADLAETTDQAYLKETTERIIRAYDPCISCAVHLLTIDGTRRQDSTGC